MTVADQLKVVFEAQVRMAAAKDELDVCIAALDEAEAGVLALLKTQFPEAVADVRPGWNVDLICGDWLISLMSNGKTLAVGLRHLRRLDA